MRMRMSRALWSLAAGSLLWMAACGEGAVGGRPAPDASGAAGSSPGGGGAGASGVAGAGQGGAGNGAAGTSSAAGTTGAAGAGALAGADGGVEAGAGGATAGTDAGREGGAGAGTGGASDAGAPPSRDETLRTRAAAAMVPLQAWYNTPTGLWQTNDWWTSANQLE